MWWGEGDFWVSLFEETDDSHMMTNKRQEAVFELVRGMTKAEKRNFRLYARRNAGNEGAKFVTLFDALDGMEEYD